MCYPNISSMVGYFDLIDRSEVLVFLDDVQFHRRSWQQKNRIILNNEYKDLTIQ